MPRTPRRTRALLAALVVGAVVLAAPIGASAKSAAGPFGILFGLDTAPDGSLLVADATQGVVQWKHGHASLLAALPNITDVDAIGTGDAYAVTGGGGPEGGPPEPGAATLYRVSNGSAKAIADLGAYEAEFNPDGTDVNPNPFDVQVLNGGGVLVADAGANTLYFVDGKGHITVVATFPEELVSTSNLKALVGCPAGPPDFCDLPPMIPAQPVSTSVAIGPDGAAYVGELKGFPAPTGESRVWRIEPGTRGAHCGDAGDTRCTVVGDGFTSIIDLRFGPDWTLYVTELDEASWAAVEILGSPTGGTVNACHLGAALSCSVLKTGLIMPTATTVSRGQVYATVFSLAPGQSNVVAIP